MPDAVTREEFRDVIGRFATGVTVVTATDDEGDHGMTASAVSSLSLDPPMLLVCMNKSSRTGDAVIATGRFTVNVLAEHQARLATLFAMPADDRFAEVGTTRRANGALALDDVLAVIDCELSEAVEAATHHVMMGRVVGVDARDGAPLAYFRGQFGQLQLARADDVTAVIREQLLGGRLPEGLLDVTDLATSLGVEGGRIERALSALRGEGLLGGDPVAGSRIGPVTPAAIDDALDARCAIELGAADLAVGATGATVAADLRRLAAQSVEVLADPDADLATYAAANTAFHEAMVRTAGSSALLDAYQRLSLPGMLLRGVRDAELLDADHGAEHVVIADAWARGDLPGVREAIVRHTEHSRRTHRAAAGS
ncbi:flavin reductase [Euzebya sp.]|uniref:flavin reductase n=1 Tax=Euzebya sp. TaxID=1971409 RepID=UPI00351572AC